MSLDENSDAELVRLFKDGNDSAYEALLCRYQDRIFRLAGLWLFDEQLAADATQEVFLRGLKGLRRFRFGASPFTWLYRTTRLVCHEFNRKRRNEPLTQEPVDSERSPSQILSVEETIRGVRDLVSGLPARQREVVVLRVFEEMSVAETAQAMGCREGTVKALLFKANKNLRGRISESELSL